MKNYNINSLGLLVFFNVCFLLVGLSSLQYSTFFSWFLHINFILEFLIYCVIAIVVWRLFIVIGSLFVRLAGFISSLQPITILMVTSITVASCVFLQTKIAETATPASGGQVFASILIFSVMFELTFVIVNRLLVAGHRFS